LATQTWTPNTQQASYIDNRIVRDLWGIRLSSDIANQIKKATDILIQNKLKWEKITPTEWDKLAILNDLVKISKERPDIYWQIKDSVSELVNISFKKEDAQSIRDAIVEYPLIKELYDYAAKNRWAILIDDEIVIDNKQQSTETPTLSDIVNASKQEQTLLTNKTTELWWTLPEKKKKQQKLGDLIKIQKQQKQQPVLSNILQTPEAISLSELVRRGRKM
jgi:hypothetical protein